MVKTAPMSMNVLGVGSFVISADDLKKAQSEISEEELAGLSGGGQDLGAWFKENITDNVVGMVQNSKDQGHQPW